MMPSAATAVSVSEYLGTEYDPNCEYIDGVLVPKPMPTWRHSRIQARILILIDSRFPEYMVVAELTVQVREGKFLIPDLAVQDASMVQEPYPIAPIVLCVEVLSPDDSLQKMLAKCEDYHAWGTVNTWILDPVERRAWEYTKGSPPQEIDRAGELQAGTIRVPVADIFRGL